MVPSALVVKSRTRMAVEALAVVALATAVGVAVNIIGPLDHMKLQTVGTNPAAITAKAATDYASSQTQAQLKQLDTNVQPGKAWRDHYHTIEWGAAQRYDQDQHLYPYSGPQNQTPEAKALNAWDAAIKAHTSPTDVTQVDWNAVDAALTPAQQALVNNYLSGGKPSSIPSVAAYKDVSSRLSSTGFFNIKSDVWKKLTAANPSASQYQTFSDYATAVKAQHPTLRIYPYQKANANMENLAITRWGLAHPQDLADAIKWGYIPYPTKGQLAIARRASTP